MTTFRCILALIFLTALPGAAIGAWFDAAWTFRRSIEVPWDEQKGSDNALAEVTFLANGKQRPDGGDIRVASEDGKLVSGRVLKVGPGDQVSVVFALVKPIKKYFVYWGNPNPPPPPKNVEELKLLSGLLMEMRRFGGGDTGNFKAIEQVWARAKPDLGAAMIPQPEIGWNPLGLGGALIYRISGSLFAHQDGDYTFAVSAPKGGLWLDGKPLAFAQHLTGHARYTASVDLKRGRHEFQLIVQDPGDARFAVVWKPPAASGFTPIPRSSFGICYGGVIGAMEEIRKNLTADFKLEYQGECFVANEYSHRMKLIAQAPRGNARFEWDIGDGQTSTAAEVEHVYVNEGTYAVRIKVSVGSNSDSQTIRIPVDRDVNRLSNPKEDAAPVHSKILARYDVATLPATWLTQVTAIHLRAGALPAALASGARLAAERRHPNVQRAMEFLDDLTRQAFDRGQDAKALALWQGVPQNSDLQPTATRAWAQYLLWWAGDPAGAVKALEPIASKDKADAGVRRIYAMGLVLSGKVAEGSKILDSLPERGRPEKRAAISGAMARTTEYFITEGDWEAGEETWDKWQAQYPMEFLEGYSILLRVKLMERKKQPLAAARIAEAFAAAVPGSSYAPQLLDRASKALAKSDPAKSKSLRALLKQRYPEDPLSQ